MKFSIKICVPEWEVAQEWGDYHIALAMKKYFYKLGHEAIIQIMPEWYNGDDADCDAVIHLRGLNRYHVSLKHVNVVWNISHPKMVSVEEYEDYDIVFVASEFYAKNLDKRLRTMVVPLLQCTDPDLFYPEATQEYSADLLFVANSRNIHRKVLKDLLPTEYYLKVWGNRWEQFIDQKYIQGQYFPNEKLRQLYSSCKILLNDHWDDMRENGFISNRIFDAFACKAFVISDEVAGLQDILQESVITYCGPEDLRGKISYYLENLDKCREIVEVGYTEVITRHTFRDRVALILDYVEPLVKGGLAKKRNGHQFQLMLKEKDDEIKYWKDAFKQKEMELERMIKEFQSSLSWRITKPLRVVHSLIFSKKGNYSFSSRDDNSIGKIQTLPQVEDGIGESHALEEISARHVSGLFDIAALRHLNKLFPPIETPKYHKDAIFERARRRFEFLNSQQIQLHGKVLLELGAGCGENLIVSLQYGLNKAVGIDTKPNKFEQLLNDIPEEDRNLLEFLCADAENFSLNKQFDLILSFNSFEHFSDPESVVQNVYKHLLPGGVAYFEFAPLFYSPWGAHRYHVIHVPYIQILFPNEVVYQFYYHVLKARSPINQYSGEPVSPTDPYPEMNKWKVWQFEQLFFESDGWEVVYFRKITDYRYKWFISLFTGKLEQLTEEDLYVSGLRVVLRKK